MILVMDMISGEVVSMEQGSRDEKLQTASGGDWHSEAEHLGQTSLSLQQLVSPQQANEVPADVLDRDPEDFVRAMERP